MSSIIYFLVVFMFTIQLFHQIGAAVSPSCIEEAEGCMCPIIKKIMELRKFVKEQDKVLKKMNKCHPTKSSPKPVCVKVTKEQNALCPIAQKVVDCWENATSCYSSEDIRLIHDIETILSTATYCDIQIPQPYEKPHKNPKPKKPSKCNPDNSMFLK